MYEAVYFFSDSLYSDTRRKFDDGEAMINKR